MLLLPIGRDDAEIRRHAWVSYTIIAINILVMVAVMTAEASLTRRWSGAFGFALAHPYLKLPPDMARVLKPAGVEEHEVMRRHAAVPAREQVEAEQAQLDAMVAKAAEALRKEPLRRFGYVPAEGGALRIISAMFLHAGLMHLIGNLIFFFVSGPFIEDVFGRPLFAALYLTGGIAATLTFASLHPDGTVPTVGASGAIAAVMGAYLVRFLRARVEFLFIPSLLRPTLHYRFFVPAFIVLPLWFAQQLLYTLYEAGGGGVAFSAHVGGFVYGVVFALAVKASAFEEKYVNPVVEKETTWSLDPRVVRAIAARDGGDYAIAKRELSSVLRDDPKNVDALRTAVDVGIASDDVSMLDTCATRLLARYADSKDDELATSLIHELDSTPRLPKFYARAATYAERSGQRDWAVTLYRRAVDADPAAPAAVSSLVKIGALLRLSGDLRGARETLARARAHPACTAEWAPAIDAKLAQLGGATRPAARPSS
ncbi:MAG TPA: rhomboid family intramembrane serine protease [Thermoanaerobaculia bacterium]|jgi:membrane associated rhomboid family serine protease